MIFTARPITIQFNPTSFILTVLGKHSRIIYLFIYLVGVFKFTNLFCKIFTSEDNTSMLHIYCLCIILYSFSVSFIQSNNQIRKITNNLSSIFSVYKTSFKYKLDWCTIKSRCEMQIREII